MHLGLRAWLQAERLDLFSELREQVSGRVGPVGQPTSLEIRSRDVCPLDGGFSSVR